MEIKLQNRYKYGKNGNDRQMEKQLSFDFVILLMSNLKQQWKSILQGTLLV